MSLIMQNERLENVVIKIVLLHFFYINTECIPRLTDKYDKTGCIGNIYCY